MINNYYEVEKPDSLTTYKFTDIKGNKFDVYSTSTGKHYYYSGRISKASGKRIRTYLKPKP